MFSDPVLTPPVESGALSGQTTFSGLFTFDPLNPVAGVPGLDLNLGALPWELEIMQRADEKLHKIVEIWKNHKRSGE